MYHFYTIHHHFHHIPETPKRCLLSCGVHKTHPNSGAHRPELTKSAVPKTHLCRWQISKTTMDLFIFRPSFTLDVCCSHFAFLPHLQATICQEHMHTARRISWRRRRLHQPAVNHNVSNGQQFQTEPQSIRKIAVVNTCGRLVYQLNLSLCTPKQQSPG